MNAISQASMIRGADGRLYAVNARGVTSVAEPGASAARTMLRAGDVAAFDTADHEASREFVTPGM
ncbi:MAG TPA: hypothetical protein VD860_11845 [Azospirillum sp.]|nr:hypothetical protein [Azospirillum sp.]